MQRLGQTARQSGKMRRERGIVFAFFKKLSTGRKNKYKNGD
jgi:hypothetical protein